MDIIDIILARSKSFTGETATLTRQAQAAMSDANDIVNRLEAIQTETEEANEKAIAAAESASSAAESLNGMKEDMVAAAELIVDEKMTDTNSELNELQESVTNLNQVVIPTIQNQIAEAGGQVNVIDSNTNTAKVKKLTVAKNNTTNEFVVEKNYTSYGDNEDGSMTQKAIKAYVTDSIRNITVSGGGSTNLGQDNAGKIVVIDENGNIVSGDTSEAAIIEALIKSGAYEAKNALGLEIDYENKSNTRTQEATYLTMGTDFNKYSMYGGRMRCNVADNGTITAFYGDNNYKEDGSNGQVMIYQPKFYYQRTPLKVINAPIGKIVRKESIIVSSTAQTGFKLHPLFQAEDGSELEYVLLPAYDSCIYDGSLHQYDLNEKVIIDFNNDKLSSIAGAKPISGVNNNFNIVNAEKLARNRGEGWHITNMAAESANQMLELVEFGTLNGQAALEEGICRIPNNTSLNCASITGSTANLGNTTGAAEVTVNERGGQQYSYTNPGYRAISYRGMENPWGNIWRFIGGVNLYGNGYMQGGVPYICTDFNYDTTAINDNYESIGFSVPAVYDWVSGLGYGNEKYDWVLLPAECSSAANSAAPVGDNFWSFSGLNGINAILIGGTWAFGVDDGPFYYACDNNINVIGRSFSAKLMFIPKKNAIYNNNYNLWLQHWGG